MKLDIFVNVIIVKRILPMVLFQDKLSSVSDQCSTELYVRTEGFIRSLARLIRLQELWPYPCTHHYIYICSHILLVSRDIIYYYCFCLYTKFVLVWLKSVCAVPSKLKNLLWLCTQVIKNAATLFCPFCTEYCFFLPFPRLFGNKSYPTNLPNNIISNCH